MNRAMLRASAWPAGLAAAGAALVCWGLALGGYWPLAFALGGQRALPVAREVLALGVLLAAVGGALLAIALVASLRVTLAPGRPGTGAGGRE
jgi:fucose permease